MPSAVGTGGAGGHFHLWIASTLAFQLLKIRATARTCQVFSRINVSEINSESMTVLLKQRLAIKFDWNWPAMPRPGTARI